MSTVSLVPTHVGYPGIRAIKCVRFFFLTFECSFYYSHSRAMPPILMNLGWLSSTVCTMLMASSHHFSLCIIRFFFNLYLHAWIKSLSCNLQSCVTYRQYWWFFRRKSLKHIISACVCVDTCVIYVIYCMYVLCTYFITSITEHWKLICMLSANILW